MRTIVSEQGKIVSLVDDKEGVRVSVDTKRGPNTTVHHSFLVDHNTADELRIGQTVAVALVTEGPR